MTIRRIVWTLALGFAVVVVHASAQPSQAVAGQTLPPSAGSQAFADRMDYYVRDGGEWVSRNDDFKAGSDQAHSYLYRWEWSLGKRIARLRIDGLLDGDKRATFWEAIVAWHPTDGRAVIRQVGAGGAYAEGTVQFTDDKTTEIRMTFYMPDGEIWAFREIDTVVAPDEFRTVSYRLKGGQWTQQRAATWIRQRKPIRSSGNQSLAVVSRVTNWRIMSSRPAGAPATRDLAYDRSPSRRARTAPRDAAVIMFRVPISSAGPHGLISLRLHGRGGVERQSGPDITGYS